LTENLACHGGVSQATKNHRLRNPL
jgi:hypothetical protein